MCKVENMYHNKTSLNSIPPDHEIVVNFRSFAGCKLGVRAKEKRRKLGAQCGGRQQRLLLLRGRRRRPKVDRRAVQQGVQRRKENGHETVPGRRLLRGRNGGGLQPEDLQRLGISFQIKVYICCFCLLFVVQR